MEFARDTGRITELLSVEQVARVLGALNRLCSSYLAAEAVGESIALVVEVRDVLHLFGSKQKQLRGI